jgi:hypothetical protein
VLVRLTVQATLLRASTVLLADGTLSLRLRRGSEALLEKALAEPERFRVFRSDPATGQVEEVQVPAGSIARADFGGDGTW